MYEQREKWDLLKYGDGQKSHVYDYKVGVEGGEETIPLSEKVSRGSWFYLAKLEEDQCCYGHKERR